MRYNWFYISFSFTVISRYLDNKLAFHLWHKVDIFLLEVLITGAS